MSDFTEPDITSPNDVKSLPEKFSHAKTDVWICRECGYANNVDKRSPQCLNCGRDYWGAPGNVPDRKELALEDLQQVRERQGRK